MVLSGGLSLVKGIYQKFEESVEECVEACNDYAIGAGESIKKLWNEVISDLDHQDDVEGSDLDVELEYDSATEMSSKNKATNSKLVHVEADLYVPSTMSQNPSVGIPCSKENWGEISKISEAISDSTNSSKQDCDQVFETGIVEKLTENAKNGTIASIHNDTLVNTLSSENQDLCVNHSYSEHIDGKLLEEDSKEIPNTSDLASSDTCLTKQYRVQVRESDDDESRVPLMKTNAYSDNDKDIRHSNPNKVFQIAQTDDYEEIEVKDCIELEKELSLILMRKVKNKSLKKKLHSAFKLLKRSSQVNHYQDECANTGFENEITKATSSTTSSHMSTLSGQNSIDSGWELL